MLKERRESHAVVGDVRLLADDEDGEALLCVEFEEFFSVRFVSRWVGDEWGKGGETNMNARATIPRPTMTIRLRCGAKEDVMSMGSWEAASAVSEPEEDMMGGGGAPQMGRSCAMLVMGLYQETR